MYDKSRPKLRNCKRNFDIRTVSHSFVLSGVLRQTPGGVLWQKKAARYHVIKSGTPFAKTEQLRENYFKSGRNGRKELWNKWILAWTIPQRNTALPRLIGCTEESCYERHGESEQNNFSGIVKLWRGTCSFVSSLFKLTLKYRNIVPQTTNRMSTVMVT